MSLSFSTVFRSLVFACICLCAIVGNAQSGRRQARPEPPPPVPTPTPEAKPSPKPEKKAELTFIVGMDRQGAFGGYPLSFYTIVQQACADRLGKNSSATASAAEQEMNRGDALRKAKSETTAYVVLLQLSGAPMSNSSTQNYDDIEIDYTVFTPVTAKVVTSGHGYQNSNRKGPLVVGPTTSGNNNLLFRERILRQAAEEVADRILRALHLVSPVPIPN